MLSVSASQVESSLLRVCIDDGRVLSNIQFFFLKSIFPLLQYFYYLFLGSSLEQNCFCQNTELCSFKGLDWQDSVCCL